MNEEPSVRQDSWAPSNPEAAIDSDPTHKQEEFNTPWDLEKGSRPPQDLEQQRHAQEETDGRVEQEVQVETNEPQQDVERTWLKAVRISEGTDEIAVVPSTGSLTNESPGACENQSPG